ncbi:unnamed protein product [Caenorhabditis sp. 36 PRJEB53466]|nr:unnamed protein product [Caenorhabditis sp. 36 PRJEB53466]
MRASETLLAVRQLRLNDDDYTQAKENIKHVAEFLKDCADVGMFVFEKMAPQLAAIVGLGLFAKNVITATEADKLEPVMKELKELKNDIRKLDEDMIKHFEDLKAYIVANEFYQNIAKYASTLTDYMADTCIPVPADQPKDTAMNEFSERYNEKKPLQLARELNFMLSNAQTSPLKMAMQADPLMTTATFNGWKENIGGVFSQLWFLELFAVNAINGGNVYFADKVKEEMDEFKGKVDEWEEDYKKNAYFWPKNIKKFVEDVQDDNTGKSDGEVAELIQKGLETILTDDIFYIISYPEASYHWYHSKLPNQVLFSLDRGGRDVIVYCSLAGRQEELDMADLEQLKTQMNLAQIDSFATTILTNDGLLIEIESPTESSVAVRSTNVDVLPNGPGVWYYDEVIKFVSITPITEKFVMLAAYK